MGLVKKANPAAVLTRLDVDQAPSYVADLNESKARAAKQAAKLAKKKGSAGGLPKKPVEIPDPVLAVLHPGVHYGAVSEKFQESVDSFVKNDPEGLFKPSFGRKSVVDPTKFEALMKLK